MLLLVVSRCGSSVSLDKMPITVNRMPAPIADVDTASLAVLRLASRAAVRASLESGAVHAFRGSINTLSLGVRVLEETLVSDGEPSSPDLQRRCIASVRDELKRLQETTGGVLEEGAAEDGGNPRPVRVSDVLDGTAAILQPTCRMRRIVLTAENGDRDTTVLGRPAWLRHAVLNLAVNAIDAMPDGGELRLRSRCERATAVLEVSDTGSGIAPHARDRIWEMYYSTGSGLGIGLPVAAHIAQTHGGAVTLEPSETGALFAIRLPVL